MMKDSTSDWLLTGCHPRSAVAVAYFGNYRYACSAVKAFLRALRQSSTLLAELECAGFDLERTTLFTPSQISILIRHWGTPEQAREAKKRFT